MSQQTTNTTDVAAAAAEVAKTFSGTLLQPGAGGYDAARRVHNGCIDKRPALIAQCIGAADIADAVNLGRDLGLEIAVRGGGHNVGGRGTVDGGLLIDLSRMRHVQVHPQLRTADVAGGALWGDFNREAQLFGLATTGGVVSSTGVGGLTLGGGLGWLMPKYGMALDNLISVDMVLADGRVVRASDEDHQDLFWAVRGGGGNFGVASAFEFEMHPVGPIVTGGLVAHPISKARDVLRLFRDLAATATDDMMLIAALLTAPDGVTKLAGLAVGHFGLPEAAAAATAPIKQFGQPVMDVIGPMPYTALNTMFDASLPRGARNYWKSHFANQLTDTAIDTLIDGFMSAASPMSQVLLEHFHGAATRVTPSHTAYALRESGFNLLFLSQWMDQADDEACIGWARTAYEAAKPHVGHRRYINYLDHDDVGDACAHAVYGSNLPRLRDVKRQYDPDNVFHVNLNIAP
ncbi:MAG TPA: FAD-binding oxidoreductase [Vicinamibacterales bacterium]|nr:FAD-binding oxidoreductase [Vicinamibacterales bacterium]